jgi:hypothetical protein
MDNRRLPAAEARYTYQFAVWPESHFGFDPAVFRLFDMIEARVYWDMTEAEFEEFRSGLARHGLKLREVARVPYTEPESVA